MPIEIYPSLIDADLMHLRRELELLDPHVDGYHVDIMDNHFVPHLTWGQHFVDRITEETSKPLNVHLMVDDPTNWIETLKLRPFSTIIIHIESAGHCLNNLKNIKNRGYKTGLAIKPETPIKTIFPLLEHVDTILVMSVEPGLSGQVLLEDTLTKIDPLVGYRQTNGLSFTIGMDGGINQTNIHQLALKGVDWVAIGTGIFKQPNKIKALQELQKLIK